LGQTEPPFRRAVSVQKCFRANDIDNVGHTARHLTMFEMLGNFAFGDYFKAESIGWGYELITEIWGIDPSRLWVTVYEHDDEARYEEIWNHVFMQERVDDRLEFVEELPAKNIDTGSSLERVATILQDKESYVETDLFRPLLEVVESITGRRHGEDPAIDVSLTVIPGHG